MNISQTTPSAIDFSQLAQAASQRSAHQLQRHNNPSSRDPGQVREAFTQFVGETFFAQMLKAMRSSMGKPAYFHGGRAEEIFTSQLDQTLAEELADKSTERLIDPLFERQFPQLAQQIRESQAANADATSPTKELMETSK